MKVFTATNGILFTITEDGVLRWEGGYDPRRVTDALREYFQRERDTQLGRWRDPENPDLVCYPDEMSPNWVLVIQESTGDTDTVFRHTWGSTEDDEFILVADRYFAAHREPKPWEEAKAGEVWILTRYGAEDPFFVTGGEFTSTDLAVATDLDDPRITDGRRIWPEGENK